MLSYSSPDRPVRLVPAAELLPVPALLLLLAWFAAVSAHQHSRLWALS